VKENSTGSCAEQGKAQKKRRSDERNDARTTLEQGRLSQRFVRRSGAGVNFPPATSTPAVPNQRLEHGVATPAPVKIASAESELGLTGRTPGKQPENFDQVAAIGASGSE